MPFSIRWKHRALGLVLWNPFECVKTTKFLLNENKSINLREFREGDSIGLT